MDRADRAHTLGRRIERRQIEVTKFVPLVDPTSLWCSLRPNLTPFDTM
jgi:hypothetical protein